MELYPFNPDSQKLKTDSAPVDQAFTAHVQISAAKAVAPDSDGIHASVTLTASAQTITTGITSPAASRNITVTGSAAGIEGNVTVTGTNYANDTITEAIALNGTSTVAGTKAFKTVTSIALPTKTNTSGDAVTVGFGSAFGLPFKLARNTIISAYLDNTKESTLPTVTVSASALESNTFTLSSSLAGKAVDAYFIYSRQ